MEQTFVMIKPDGVQRGLVGEIIRKFEKKGFSWKGLRHTTLDRPFAEKHHADLPAKPFFSRLVDYFISGPIVAMIWEGENVVLTGRNIIGATNPSECAPVIGRSFIHGSESVESARKEIALWFPDGSVNWESGLRHLISIPASVTSQQFFHRYNIDSLRRTKEFVNFNLREGTYGAVIARVRHQGGLGICWAMAITSVMEIVIAKQYKFNRDIILSSQEMVDSVWAKLESLKSTPKKPDQFGGYAMHIDIVFKWMESFGVTIADSDPPMRYRQNFRERLPGTRVALITDRIVVDPNNEELMIAILHKGFCLCASFHVFREFNAYKHGENAVYEGTSEGTSEGVETSSPGHTVVITGYGTTPRGKKFWWIKNSWGDGWGDKGFGKLYRGSDAFNPRTGQRDLNLLYRVIACMGIKLCKTG